MNSPSEFHGPRIVDVIDALRTDLTTYHGLDLLKAHNDAADVYDRIRHRLHVMDPRLKDEVIVALVSRQAYPLAHKMVYGGRSDIEVLTGPATRSQRSSNARPQ